MAHQIHTVIASELAFLIDNPQCSDLSLYGSNGGTSLIIGKVCKTNVVLDMVKVDNASLPIDMVSVETEHGTVWIEADKQVRVLEDLD